MENWIRETFDITPNGWMNMDGTETDAFSFFNGEQYVKSSIEWFVATFGAVSTPPTEKDLKAVDADNSMGWYTHFKTWRAQGLIN